MKKKGRKSAQKLSVVTPLTKQSPRAPKELTSDEAKLWEKIAKSKSVEFFDPGTIPLLKEYCRLHTSIELLAGEIATFDEDWINDDDGWSRYQELTDRRDKFHARLIALARSMRLTNQSRFQPVTAAARSSGNQADAKIWQRS